MHRQPRSPVSHFSTEHPPNLQSSEQLHAKPLLAQGIGGHRAVCSNCEPWDQHSTLTHETAPPPPPATNNLKQQKKVTPKTKEPGLDPPPPPAEMGLVGKSGTVIPQPSCDGGGGDRLCGGRESPPSEDIEVRIRTSPPSLMCLPHNPSPHDASLNSWLQRLVGPRPHHPPAWLYWA